MSKLKEVLGGTRFVKVPEISAQINDLGISRTQQKNVADDIKELFLEIVGNEKGINPNNKDFYDGYKLAINEITDKIKEL